MWAALLLLAWLLPWTVPPVRRRIANSRILDVLWHGVFSGIFVGVWWRILSGANAVQATVVGAVSGALITLIYAATWERIQRRATSSPSASATSRRRRRDS